MIYHMVTVATVAFNDIHSYFGVRLMGEVYLTISLIQTFRLSEQNILLVVQRGSEN